MAFTPTQMAVIDADAQALPSASHFRQRATPAGWTTFNGVTAMGQVDFALADRAVDGRVEVVGVEWAFPSKRIDWTFNPTNNSGPFNPEWTWQLNRMSFWRALADAYRATGDEKYARAFAQQLEDWLAQTGGVPPETGYNSVGSPWRTIEEGLRLFGSWRKAYEIFRKSPSLSDELLLAFVRSAHAQARHLLAHRTSKNWLLIEMTGVIVFALDFPEFADSGKLLDEALRAFCEAASAQLLPDGFHYELSPDYHSVFYATTSIVYLRTQAACVRNESVDKLRKVLERGAEGYIDMMTPGFVMPRVNDTYTLPVSAVLKRAAEFFPERDDFLWAASGGRQGTPPPGAVASRFLPYAGFAVMRTGWSDDSTCVVFDVGPLGEGHFHQDKLSFSLWKGKEELVFDDGGGMYENSSFREYAVSGYDHSTLLVDGLSEKRKGPYSLKSLVEAGWRSSKTEDFAFGVYDQGFGPGMTPLAKWRREMRFVKAADRLFVDDSVDSSDGNEHEYSLLFQLDTTNVIVSADGRQLRATYAPNRKWALEISLPEGVTVELASGRQEPSLAGWFFAREQSGKIKRPATTVFLKAKPCKSFHFATVLTVVPASSDC